MLSLLLSFSFLSFFINDTKAVSVICSRAGGGKTLPYEIFERHIEDKTILIYAGSLGAVNAHTVQENGYFSGLLANKTDGKDE